MTSPWSWGFEYQNTACGRFPACGCSPAGRGPASGSGLWSCSCSVPPVRPVLHPPALHCTVLHCTALHCIVLYCTAPSYTALPYPTMHWLRCTLHSCIAQDHCTVHGTVITVRYTVQCTKLNPPMRRFYLAPAGHGYTVFSVQDSVCIVHCIVCRV